MNYEIRMTPETKNDLRDISMLEYKGYHASVEYDAEDNIFVGEVFGITDSLNFHGISITELKEMFEQCIDNYLDLCEKVGKNPNKEFM